MPLVLPSLGALYPPLRASHPEPLVQGPIYCLLPTQVLIQLHPVSVTLFGCNWQKPTQAYLGKKKKTPKGYWLIHIIQEELKP